MIGKTLKNVSQLVSGNIVAMALPVLMIPIYTRLYSPEEYSRWGFLSSFVLIFGIIQGLSTDLIIVKFKDDLRVKNFLTSGAFWFVLICFCLNLILLFEKNTTGILNMSYSEIMLVSSAVLFVGLSLLGRGYYNYFEKYNVIATSVILVSATQVVFRLSLPFIGFQKFNLNLLFVSYVLAQLGGVIYLFSRAAISKTRCSLNSFFIGLKSFPELAFFQTLSKLFELGSLHMVLLMLTGFYSATQIGYYTMSLQLALLPAALIGSALGTVLYKDLIVMKEQKTTVDSVKFLIKMSFVLSIIFGIIFLLGLGKLVVCFLGNDWKQSLPTLRVLIGMSIPIIITQPLNYIFKAQDKMRLKFILNLVLFIVPLSFLYVAMCDGADYDMAVKYYGIAMAFCSTVIIVIAMNTIGLLKDLLMKGLICIQLVISLTLLL